MFLFGKKNTHPKPEQLSLLLPFKRLDREDLYLISKQATLLKAKKGKRIFKKGSCDNWTHFLLSGELKLKDSVGNIKTLVSGSTDASTAISHLQPRIYTATAITNSTYIKLNRTLLDNIRPDKKNNNEELLSDANIKKATYHNNSLYKQVHADLISNKLKFPAFQEISTKIIKQLLSRNKNPERVSKIIQADPVLTAKLIKAANGPLYYGQKEVDTCKDAVKRLGVITSKSICIDFLQNEQILIKLHNPSLQQYADHIKKYSFEVAAISSIIGGLLKDFSAEKAMLAGLIHNIGAFPVLYYAEQHPELINGLENVGNTIKQLSGELGALLLKQWCFPQELITVAREANSWMRNNNTTPDYCDIVLIAQAFNSISKKNAVQIPKFQQIPALKKLGLDKLTAKDSIKLLKEAKNEVIKIKKLLK